jgi:hypothetical protein
MKPDIHDDLSWGKISNACWGFGARRVDPRLPSFSGVHDVLAAISCVGQNAWVIYIHGEHRAQVESWDEAKSIAAVLLNSKEME